MSQGGGVFHTGRKYICHRVTGVCSVAAASTGINFTVEVSRRKKHLWDPWWWPRPCRQKIAKSIYHTCNAPVEGDPVRILQRCLVTRKLKLLATMLNKVWRHVNRIDAIPECGKRTDRRTDGQNCYQYRASALHLNDFKLSWVNK